jgi:hypothetical protein
MDRQATAFDMPSVSSDEDGGLSRSASGARFTGGWPSAPRSEALSSMAHNGHDHNGRIAGIADPFRTASTELECLSADYLRPARPATYGFLGKA